MNDFDGKTVAVAVSGGVDSLYSLLSLRERHPGAHIFALHALFLPADLCGLEYERMLEILRTGCERLGVKLLVADCSGEFARLVMDPFAESYFAGRTPNPCAGCNRDIKFGLLWEKAAGLGADILITGHYARLEFDGQGRPMLLNGQDAAKDQSYFLALTPLERLARARFPLGRTRKSDILAELEERNRRFAAVVAAKPAAPSANAFAADVPSRADASCADAPGTADTSERQRPEEGSASPAAPSCSVRPAACGAAKGRDEHAAPQAACDALQGNFTPTPGGEFVYDGPVEVPVKGESQEICFIPGNNYRAFLADWAARHPEAVAGNALAEGDMLLPDGRVMGRHKGLWAYTEGQRKGLGIAWSEPLYVIGKDLERNALLLGTASDLNSRSCLCTRVNFLLPREEWPELVYAKTRYRQALQPAKTEFTAEGLLRLEFIETLPSAPAAPGQVAAFYAPVEHNGERCFRLLAGGEIIRG